MALATRCPDCQAVFRVVSDQLKLRGGLVRCGNCRHVFDAIGSLSYVEDAAVSVLSPRPTDGAGATRARDEAAAAPAAGSPDSSVDARTDGRAAEAPRAASEAAGTDGPHREPGVATRPHPAQNNDAARPSSRQVRETSASACSPDPLSVPTLLAPRTSDDAATPAADATAREPAAADATTQPATDHEPEHDTPRRKRSSRKREPAPGDQAAPVTDATEAAFLKDTRPALGFSIVYGGGSLLLALLLLLQSAVALRSELLVRWPELRPSLAALCELYGCTVGWPTRAEKLAVVGTELQAVPGTDILELTAVIRNRASYRVALPAVEVTLTDTANRMLARKVFAPVDYLASSGEPSSRLKEGIGPGSDYVVRITFEARGLNAAGFVVYPFYL